MRNAITLAIVGIVMIAVGLQQRTLHLGAGQEPWEMTAKELAEEGPGQNLHVVLKSFRLAQDEYLYYGDENDYETVYVPVKARSGRYAKKIGIVLKSSQPEDHDDVLRLAREDRIQGMVINDIESLGDEEKKLLEEGYPDVSFDAVYIFEHNRKPPSGKSVLTLIGGGLACLIGSLGVWRMGRDD